MNTATATLSLRPEASTNFRALAARIGAALRHAIALSGETYLVKGSRYL
ncbi:hypothetical protein [Massilia sp. 9I]|nr:hypothetical protein [Massilia sp. 9I]VXB82028.1 conserved hypothetical protein [Massilia sp. 9I]